MTDRDAQNLAAFLASLSDLTIKHRISLGGCGCCGSPYLVKIEDGDALPVGSRYVVDAEGECLKFQIAGE